MVYLILVSIIWAFSFGLIGHYLSDLPPILVACLRLGISLLVFLPFMKRRPWSAVMRYMSIGAVQFGLMYMLYIAAFSFIPSYEVALFTSFTPLYIIVTEAFLSKRWPWWGSVAALCAILGGLGILSRGMWIDETRGLLSGFILIQFSNLFFALGQVFYARWNKRMDLKMEGAIFGYLYLGGFLVTLPILCFSGGDSFRLITVEQWMILIYLGAVASGICFFLWNHGAKVVSASLLSVMNNLKIPLVAMVSIFLFHEVPDYWSVGIGSGLIIVALIISLYSNDKKDALESKGILKRKD